MRHPVRVIKGEWADRSDVAFSGSVLYSKNDRIDVQSMTRTQVVLDQTAEIEGYVVVEIDTPELNLVVEMGVRAWQSLAARSTARVRRTVATARDTELQRQLSRYEAKDEAQTPCCGRAA